MRIAHLSDLHLSPDHFPERSELFREILLQCTLLNVDHIVITGDITNQAKPKEFHHARSILKEFGFLDPSKLTVTIGNHDIYGGPYYAEDVLSFPGSCRETDYDAKVMEFFSSFHESFEGCKYVSGMSIFPFVKILQDVAFVGINSVAGWSSLKNPVGSNGEVGTPQYKQLKEIFGSEIVKDKTVIVLIHHHFNKMGNGRSAGGLARLWQTIETATMTLWKKERLFQLFRKAKIGRILHGHLHHHHNYSRKNLEFLNAGATIFSDSEGMSRFHLLTINGKKIENIDIDVTLPKRMESAVAN